MLNRIRWKKTQLSKIDDSIEAWDWDGQEVGKRKIELNIILFATTDKVDACMDGPINVRRISRHRNGHTIEGIGPAIALRSGNT